MIRLIALLLLLLIGQVTPASAARPETGESDADTAVVVGVRFGLVDEDEQGEIRITEARRITLRPGAGFGWSMSVVPARPYVPVRQELILPHKPAIWSGDGLQISADGRIATLEEDFEWDGGPIVSTWKFAEGDPPGRYAIRLYLSGRLVEVIEFDVVEPSP